MYDYRFGAWSRSTESSRTRLSRSEVNGGAERILRNKRGMCFEHAQDIGVIWQRKHHQALFGLNPCGLTTVPTVSPFHHCD
jgi:hypothetical protein